jgi:SAM-dependent methyltransferase
MFRRRLRPAYTAEQLRQVYETPHDHRKWADHHLRVDSTIVLARWLSAMKGVRTAADLSCGNGAILDAIPAEKKYYGDFAPGYDFTGPLEETLDQIPNVDLYICSETIEHLDDPDKVLAQIRQKAKMMVLSTPIGEDDDNNPEHYWGWDMAAVGEMLAAAGWQRGADMEVRLRPAFVYDYQIWACL